MEDAVVTLMEEVQDQASRLGSLTEGLRRLAAAVEKERGERSACMAQLASLEEVVRHAKHLDEPAVNGSNLVELRSAIALEAISRHEGITELWSRIEGLDRRLCDSEGKVSGDDGETARLAAELTGLDRRLGVTEGKVERVHEAVCLHSSKMEACADSAAAAVEELRLHIASASSREHDESTSSGCSVSVASAEQKDDAGETAEEIKFEVPENMQETLEELRAHVELESCDLRASHAELRLRVQLVETQVESLQRR